MHHNISEVLRPPSFSAFCIQAVTGEALGSVSILGLVVLVDEGQNIGFGQFLRIHPGLRIVNYDPVNPGPEETLRVADTEDGDKFIINYCGTTTHKKCF